MKRSIAVIFAASTLFLAGCCTSTHVTKWEYKVAVAPRMPAIQFGAATNAPASDESIRDIRQRRGEAQQEFLNGLGKDGWVLINENEGTFYFKRPIK